MSKKALISVSNKEGIVAFAQFLAQKGLDIISTGGTYKHLKENGIAVQEVSQITQFPEMLDGRVKTLHPYIHGGILAKRNIPEHLETLSEHGISEIAVVVVNLYPFFENVNKELSLEELVEFIDIGGPTMLRAAAKSFFDVTVVSDPDDYTFLMENWDNLEVSHRKNLAGKVFNLTSAYDAAIAQSLLDEPFPTYFNASLKKVADLRYGENPHQKAAYYEQISGSGALKDFVQNQGKELSFNNIRDMDLAWKVVQEFDENCCCAVKHSTPCGVALDKDPLTAYQKAHDCDPISIFGGIVACNFTVTQALAEKMNEIFLEIVMAPAYEKEALEVFAKKKNLRVITITQALGSTVQWVTVDGGMLIQEMDKSFSSDIQCVTEKEPTQQQLKDLIFAQKVIKHVKSNAIVVAHNQQTLGVGTGQTNRIWAAQEAVERAKEKETQGLVLASDAFFPFRDVVDFAAQEGVEAIIQPGGSIRDTDSIEACNEHGLAMVVTGMRHFLH